jgi:phosphate transport system substrate-binding protein
MHRRILICLAMTALVVGGFGTATASAASLKGAGSTLIGPLLTQWGNGWVFQTGNTVTYSQVGSLAGITQVTGRSVDFGASDAPLTSAQAAACNGCVEIPWALSATAIVFHLTGISHLKLTGAVIAQIYLGEIKQWNDPRIARLNKRTTLPAIAITPVYRGEGSGDTYAFTDFLTGASSAWASKVSRGALVNFPVGISASGNAGVASTVTSTNGAIGYLAAPYVISKGLPAAAIENSAGHFEYPNLSNIENAASTVRSVPANNELHIVNPPRTAKSAYPVSTFTYVIVPHAPAQKALLQSFIAYALGAGQNYGAPLDFAKIPTVVLRASQHALASLS